MAAINNFSLVGIGSSVKLGKTGVVLSSNSTKLTVGSVNIATETFVSDAITALDLPNTYQAKNAGLTSLAGLTGVGLVKQTATNVFELDTTEYASTVLTGDADFESSTTTVLDGSGNLTEAVLALDAYIATLNNAALATEINAIETSLGAMVDDDGVWVSFAGTNYIDSAVDTTEAFTLIDTQVKTNADDIATNSSAITALQTEVDLIETSVGLGITGAFVTITGNYTGSATTVVGAIQAVDTQVKTNTDAIALKAATTYVDSQDALKLNLAGGTLTGALILAGAPTTALEAANKGYVDGIAAGLSFKQSALAATTANIASFTATPSTLDGVNLTVGDRILVKDQTDAKQNGIYAVTTLGTGANGTWTRTLDADDTGEIKGGTFVFVTAGTVNADKGFVVTAPDGSVTIGTDNIVWTQYSSTGTVSVSAGTGIDVSGNPDYIVSLADIAADTGTFGSASQTLIITVDTYGRVGTSVASDIAIATSQVTGLDTALTGKASTSTVAALQTEVDAVETGVGLNTDGTYTAPTGTTYLGATTTVKGGLVALDTQVKANTDAFAAKADKTYVDAADALLAPLANPTFTGTVTVPTPTNATDATTKEYVDAAIDAVEIPGATVTKKVAVALVGGTLVAGLPNGAFISRITVKVTTAYDNAATFTATHNSVTVADAAFSDLATTGVYVIDDYYDAAVTGDVTFAITGSPTVGVAVAYIEYVNP